MNMPFPPPSASSKGSADAASSGKGKPAKVRPSLSLLVARSAHSLRASTDALSLRAQTAPAFDLHSFLHEHDPGAPSTADGDIDMAA